MRGKLVNKEARANFHDLVDGRKTWRGSFSCHKSAQLPPALARPHYEEPADWDNMRYSPMEDNFFARRPADRHVLLSADKGSCRIR